VARLENSAAVLLAAGLSRRYGAVGKLLADFRGQPLARHAAETIATLPLARRIAVCRTGDDDLAGLFEELGFTVVRNPDTARGQASSLGLGVEAAGQPEALLVCLADMPLVPAAHLRVLVERVTPGGVVASVAGPREAPTPPAAFAREYLPELLRIEGDKGARHLLQIAERVTAPAGTLADFDTPEDFRRWVAASPRLR
jgi:molybdenum cofactor cytidylyltransferase